MFLFSAFFFFFKQKTAYELRISDWSSDVCSSDLSGSGKATSNHLAQVMFDRLAGVKTTYVPFKGTGAAVTALLGKQVAAAWGYNSVGASHRDQVRMLAVAMDERHPQFPDVPTFKELGIDLSSGASRVVAVPESTPEALPKHISEIGRAHV